MLFEHLIKSCEFFLWIFICMSTSACTDILYGPHTNYGPEKKNTGQPCATNCLLAARNLKHCETLCVVFFCFCFFARNLGVIFWRNGMDGTGDAASKFIWKCLARDGEKTCENQEGRPCAQHEDTPMCCDRDQKYAHFARHLLINDSDVVTARWTLRRHTVVNSRKVEAVWLSYALLLVEKKVLE